MTTGLLLDGVELANNETNVAAAILVENAVDDLRLKSWGVASAGLVEVTKASSVPSTSSLETKLSPLRLMLGASNDMPY